jgi:hypothetical protein
VASLRLNPVPVMIVTATTGFSSGARPGLCGPARNNEGISRGPSRPGAARHGTQPLHGLREHPLPRVGSRRRTKTLQTAPPYRRYNPCRLENRSGQGRLSQGLDTAVASRDGLAARRPRAKDGPVPCPIRARGALPDGATLVHGRSDALRPARPLASVGAPWLNRPSPSTDGPNGPRSAGRRSIRSSTS